MRAAGREWESICPLADQFSASRAALTGFAVLSFGYRVRN